ncbi:malonyl-[acyl-carrier protein] O-methyltransferase-like [Hydractinia symbiolongicarpus]|uniref:malonyl-[acyl-carrier protein] O-methyltransferase-like n=1 Tax=Hydractinia symbiolongicarpus TaxID=13093 RepID=UPI00254E2DB4|nr:malonyl-[acyl-carrier protein] O-methyltransferase-like [Hydractinia symbiolongicarpus]
MTSSKNAVDYRNYNHIVQKELFTKLITELDIKPGFRCLDIGCGPGNFTKLLVDCVGQDGYVLGIDPDEDRINLAKITYTDFPNLEFLCVKAQDMPTDLQKFDVVFSSCVMHFLTNVEKWRTFENVFKTLTSQGTFSFGCPLEIPAAIKEVYRHVEDQNIVPFFVNSEQPTVKIYEQKLTEVGFKVMKINVVENTFVFQTLDQYLVWLSASVKSEIDIIELCRKHENHLNLERNKNGEYLLKNHYVFVYAQKA